mgnify:CR=1 FL=1
MAWLALILSEKECTAAGVYTLNRVKAAVELFPDLMEGGYPPELGHVQGEGGGHALIVVVYDGDEHRGDGQASAQLHLRQVLVVLQ